MKEDIGVQIQDEPLDIIEEIEGVKEDLFTMRKTSKIPRIGSGIVARK